MVNFIKGIFIGAGAILPGISSGVICMVFGIYEKLIDSILGFFKDIKNNFKFLFPICFGVIVSIMLFSGLILYCFKIIPSQTKSLFIGLLLGSTYVLYIKDIKSHLKKGVISNITSFLVCFIIGIFLIHFENTKIISEGYFPNEFSFLFLVFSGFCMSIGIVVPRRK